MVVSPWVFVSSSVGYKSITTVDAPLKMLLRMYFIWNTMSPSVTIVHVYCPIWYLR